MSSTVETALALPSLLVVTAALVWVQAGVGAQLRCTDEAGAAARAVARGDDPAQVAATVRLEGAVEVDVSSGPAVVEVTVKRRVAGPAGLPAVTVASTASALREDR